MKLLPVFKTFFWFAAVMASITHGAVNIAWIRQMNRAVQPHIVSTPSDNLNIPNLILSYTDLFEKLAVPSFNSADQMIPKRIHRHLGRIMPAMNIWLEFCLITVELVNGLYKKYPFFYIACL